MSRELFRRIQAAAVVDDVNFPVDQHIRWIQRLNVQDADLMANADVEVLPLGMLALAARIIHKDEKYFCFSGLHTPEDAPPGLIRVDATPGLFASVIFHSSLPAKATAAEVRNVIDGAHKEVDGYEGQELQSVVKLFPELLFYALEKESDHVFLQSIERTAGSFCARGYPGFPLPLSGKVLNGITTLFEAGPDTIPFGLPLQGLLSYNFPAFFLDLYRCLEQLYSAPRMEDLMVSISHQGSPSQLAAMLERHLSWRPREEESLSKILGKTSQPVRDALFAPLSSEDAGVGVATSEKCASKIYSLRNSYVHFRPALNAQSMAPERWDDLITAMCIAVDEIYSHYGERFFMKGD